MTQRLVDVSKWQVDRPDPLDLAKAKAAGFTLVNIALTKGTSSHWPSTLADAPRRYADRARELGMGLCVYHWLNGSASGAAQANAFWQALQGVGGSEAAAHQLDCEDSTNPATATIWRDYVNATQDRLGRHLVNYTGDWWWQTSGRNWNGADLTPYLWAAPNAGYLSGYPGDQSAHWTAGYGGWPTYAVLQYMVGPLPGTGNCSLSAIRDPAVWDALTGTGGTMATSQNGWPASPDKAALGIVNPTVYGVDFPQGVRGGDVATVLLYVAKRFHETVEPLRDGTCWGYYYRVISGSTTLSNHASGTAIDCNADRHPLGSVGTFTAAQVTAIRAILAYCGGVVRWGGDFSTRKDEMHFEIRGGAAEVAALASKIKSTGGLFMTLTAAQEKQLFDNVTDPLTNPHMAAGLYRIHAIAYLLDKYAGGPEVGKEVLFTKAFKAMATAISQVDEAVGAQLADDLAAIQAAASEAAAEVFDPVATAAEFLKVLPWDQLGQVVAAALPADQADRFIDELVERLKQQPTT